MSDGSGTQPSDVTRAGPRPGSGRPVREEEIPATLYFVLVGLPGSGKSSVGRGVAERLGMRFVDLDTEVERLAGMPVAEIFAEGGEPRFRELELEASSRLATSGEPAVVASGGGWAANARAVALIRPLARIVYLRAAPERALERLQAAGGVRLRPLLGGGGGGDPLGSLRALLAAREQFYRAADAVVETDMFDLQEVTDAVVRLVRISGRV